MMSHGYDRDGNKVDKGTRSIPKAAALYTLVTATRYESFKTLLVRWIVYCQVAFAMLENEYFRELLACLNQSVANLLPRERATLRRWIMDEYVTQRAVLKNELAQAISDVHLSFDLWTAAKLHSHFKHIRPLDWSFRSADKQTSCLPSSSWQKRR